MRLQRITTNYPSYLRQFYADRPELEVRPYAAQHAALMLNACGWTDFWSVALGKKGYECNEVVSNAEAMQQSWAREHGVAYDGNNWLEEITTAQVKAFKPDVLFVNDYVTFSSSYLRQLKSECPSIRLVLGWCGAPYTDASVFQEYDVVLSSVPELVEDFRVQGLRTCHINHAFDPRVLERLDSQPAAPEADFTFIGSISKRSNFHHEREKLLLPLIDKTSLQIWSDTYLPSWQERGGGSLRRLAYDAVQSAQRMGIPQSVLQAVPPVAKVTRWESRPPAPQPVDTRLARRLHRPLFGLEMFRKLQRSKVSLNTHIDLSARYASNMRLYEATGVGSCLLTDWKENLSELFQPDVEVVAYRSAAECAEKVQYLLDHEYERRSIAMAGQKRTLLDHTFDRRAERLDQLIREEIGRRYVK
ncbi:MAG: glycosyltransferase [Pyrinomonadaceae bacterium]